MQLKHGIFSKYCTLVHLTVGVALLLHLAGDRETLLSQAAVVIPVDQGLPQRVWPVSLKVTQSLTVKLMVPFVTPLSSSVTACHLIVYLPPPMGAAIWIVICLRFVRLTACGGLQHARVPVPDDLRG